jgi:hypothetical protein
MHTVEEYLLDKKLIMGVPINLGEFYSDVDNLKITT